MEFSLPLSWRIAAAFGLIILNGCFVVAEYALVRVRASRLELLARQGNMKAIRAQGILQNFEIYLSAIQLGITMASLGLGWIGQPAVAHLLEGWLRRAPYGAILAHSLSFLIAFVLITFTQILIGELIPRSIGLLKAEVIALWTALPLRLYYLAFRTPVTFLANTSMRVLRMLHLPRVSEAEAHLSEDEIRILLGSTEERPGFSLERLMLIENIFDFGSAKVSDAMIPPEKIAYLSLSAPWKDNLEVIRGRRYSRYPLCRSDINTPIGLVHAKDILLSLKSGGGPLEAVDLEKIRRDLTEVSPGDSLQKLLQSFADKGVHMALVRDQKNIVGLVTLEDVLEEIVGEIHDEFDLPQAWSLMDVIVPSAVDVGIENPDRQQLIRRLLTKLQAANPKLNLEETLKAVWDREIKFSSAMGYGIAIPHARLASLERPLVAVGRSVKPLPFPAPDSTPVRLVFLVLTPAMTPVVQLKILSRIAVFVSNENLRRRLLRAKTSEHLLEILRTADTVMAA